ncbi:SAM-dependent methyltransferase [Amycolatopsis antarctica]|uniref:SAM-dependent methyltransferase n=1 Tax=Amycolatopsis antarctica TaxID=1854586 RepID=A0A263D2I7_9PSEU|nr:class I SAM-dependent methyltransferase [Amycolatopsis antarctica]OZM72288.1 SAM-dependent methyltransferase [Amycolatopsis antarctica]
MDVYWNHNTAYHPRIVTAARRLGGTALDIGCGDGLLAARLAEVCEHVVGVEPDATAMDRARVRLGHRPGVTLHHGSFPAWPPDGERYDLVTLVATLHHLDTATALTRARDLLRPGGELFVVGLTRNATAGDWVLSGLALPWVRALGVLHRERRDAGLVTARPQESLAEIRGHADRLLPGATLRRGLYYRYVLRWTRPR